MTERSWRKVVSDLDAALSELLRTRAFSRQPDSRAFGAFVEDAIVQSWPELCAELGVRPLPRPGRRTIYDAAWLDDGGLVGVDVRTKDLATTRYSDGGICAVGNLLRWMIREEGTLLVAEVGYLLSDAVADIRYVATSPIHVLPAHVFRIENLGTGQVRLNGSVAGALADVDWSRTREQFIEIFSELCVDHYRRVAEAAGRRAAEIESFVESSFTAIALR